MTDLRTALLSELKSVLKSKNIQVVEVENTPNDISNDIPNNISKKSVIKNKKVDKEIKKLDKIPEKKPDNSYKFTESITNKFDLLFCNQICNYKDLLPKIQRYETLRNRYKCILASDIVFLKGIFTQIRNFFYSQPVLDNNFIIGGIYVHYLEHRGHSAKKLFIVNFRCESDLDIVPSIMKLAGAYGLVCYVSNKKF
mgnify:CR=1 FL=1